MLASHDCLPEDPRPLFEVRLGRILVVPGDYVFAMQPEIVARVQQRPQVLRDSRRRRLNFALRPRGLTAVNPSTRFSFF